MRAEFAVLAMAVAACGTTGRPAPEMVAYEIHNPTSCEAQVMHRVAPGNVRWLAEVPRNGRIVVHAPARGIVWATALTPEGGECDRGVRQPRVRRLQPPATTAS